MPVLSLRARPRPATGTARAFGETGLGKRRRRFARAAERRAPHGDGTHARV